jgi:hypothetical protein
MEKSFRLNLSIFYGDKTLSITDEYCNSNAVDDKEKIFCYRTSLLFCEMLKDLETKGYLRTELRGKDGQRELILKAILNVRKITETFNHWFDIYLDMAKPDSKQKLKRIIEISELREEEAVILLFSDMIFVFLQNIEEFRYMLLHILKLPITIKDDRKIDEKTTLNQLLKRLSKLGIKNAPELSKVIEADLRNGLSHGLFWFEKKDKDCSETHLYYSKDTQFGEVSGPIGISELFLKTRAQSLITNCLLNIIADWFEGTA